MKRCLRIWPTRRVELLRKETGAEVAGVFFAKTAYQLGPVKAAPDAHIEVAICAQDQPKNAFGLMFERYDPEREWRIRDGEAFINCGHRMNMRQGIMTPHGGQYTKSVVHPATDELLHEQSEPLADHTGHGDDKLK